MDSSAEAEKNYCRRIDCESGGGDPMAINVWNLKKDGPEESPLSQRKVIIRSHGERETFSPNH